MPSASRFISKESGSPIPESATTAFFSSVVSGSFADYLKANNDPCFRTDEFLKQGADTAPVRALHDFIKGSKFLIKPHEVVFREKFSSLVNKNGKKLEKF